MAKLRRYRRYYRKSGRWAANIEEINASITATSGIFSSAETLVTNLSQENTRTSQTFTIKNVEITFTIEDETRGELQSISAGRYLEGITIYIMYVPQGMNVTSQYNIQHPEYIMAYKYVGSPLNEIANQVTSTTPEISVGQTYQPTRIKTRLARKLQTGDNIILFIKGINQNNNASQLLRINGVIRWWSKAN